MTHRTTIPTPEFDSEITKLVIELERQRWKSPPLSAHPGVYLQIKAVFHLIESLASARIEGNRTTIDELVEATVSGERDATEQLREIGNIGDAMVWVDRIFRENPEAQIDSGFIRELHRLVVKNLRQPDEGGEGDPKPGQFRSRAIAIRGARHTPPSPFELEEYIAEFVDFVNVAPDARYDLLRVAVAHHRFEYLHPFRNGNGTVGRLLTYAMLVRAGFRVQEGHLLNPAAMFCRDRAAYMNALSAADTTRDEDLLSWCEFVLRGLYTEIVKMSNLLVADTLRDEVLHPTLDHALRCGKIAKNEHTILNAMTETQLADAQLFKGLHPTKSASSVSQIIAGFKNRKLIVAYPNENSRTYIVNYHGSELLPSLVAVLHKQGYWE